MKIKPIDEKKAALMVQGIQDCIIENVERLMKERGIEKIEQLAKRAGINRATVYTVLQKDPAKRKNTKLATIVVLAMALDVGVMDLLTKQEQGNG